jgi:hypothetical protein
VAVSPPHYGAANAELAKAKARWLDLRINGQGRIAKANRRVRADHRYRGRQYNKLSEQSTVGEKYLEERHDALAIFRRTYLGH